LAFLLLSFIANQRAGVAGNIEAAVPFVKMAVA